MTEPREFCESCQRWTTVQKLDDREVVLAHDQRYCPLFPDAPPPKSGWGSERARKWSKCRCLVHTCYDAPSRDETDAPEYWDFP